MFNFFYKFNFIFFRRRSFLRRLCGVFKQCGVRVAERADVNVPARKFVRQAHVLPAFADCERQLVVRNVRARFIAGKNLNCLSFRGRKRAGDETGRVI